jgi:predicted GNAT superfamily acetyltransferase
MTQPVAAAFIIRSCDTLAELEACVDLQRRVWGYSDADLVPVPILIVARKTGGHVLGAFDDDRLVGFTLGFAAHHSGAPHVHSHFLAVLPEYRDRGVGRALKLQQREHCLRQGIHCIEWTFDPLEIKNARLNIVRLGSIVRKFIPNLYGVTSSRLHGNLPTDRLVAEWRLDSPRVTSALAGNPEPSAAAAVRIALPVDIAQMRQDDSAAARAIQSNLRREFERHFSRGYAITGFHIAPPNAIYLLEPYED